MTRASERAGRYEQVGTHYKAFVPAPLPPSPPLRISDTMADLLSRADIALGRLDGVAEFTPNPNLFLAMYVRMVSDAPMPVLIRAALVHYQFETIHPFLDGNGRLGRLLVTLMLCERGVLKKPMLYLSYCLKRHRQEYYQRLSEVHTKCDFEGWVEFFLRAVIETADHATNMARQIVNLNASHRRLVAEAMPRFAQATPLLEWLYDNPITTTSRVAEALNVTFPTAAKLVDGLGRLGILVETTRTAKGRLYAYRDYLSIMCDDDTPLEISAALDSALVERLSAPDGPRR